MKPKMNNTMKSTNRPLLLMLILALAATPLLGNASEPDGWTSDFAKAKTVANKKDQQMLLLFTGSDWCIWCKRLKDEILSKPDFKDWAADNIVLVYLDYPRNDYRGEELRQQNAKLGKTYDIKGYPTVVVAAPDGKEMARLGYMEGGPKTFIRALKKVIN